jgi:hypothetical protein
LLVLMLGVMVVYGTAGDLPGGMPGCQHSLLNTLAMG